MAERSRKRLISSSSSAPSPGKTGLTTYQFLLQCDISKKDRERSAYGLKEKNLAKAYIKLIPLNNKDPDAIRLLNWKRPTDKNVRAASDTRFCIF